MSFYVVLKFLTYFTLYSKKQVELINVGIGPHKFDLRKALVDKMNLEQPRVSYLNYYDTKFCP